ncbi:MAG: hypothetical protein P4M12_09195, partial [Gammaproteobacteria bacterium]|nr:hypothetical protein [Gammaproteobacteria bacterium]
HAGQFVDFATQIIAKTRFRRRPQGDVQARATQVSINDKYATIVLANKGFCQIAAQIPWERETVEPGTEKPD